MKTRDAGFTASEKYQETEALVRSRYDLETMRRDFHGVGYMTLKPEWPEGVLDSAQAFTKEILVGRPPIDGVRDGAGQCHQDRFTDTPSVRAVA